MKKLYSLKFSLGECIKSVLNPKPIITGEMFIFSLNLEIIGILPPSFINKGYFPQTSLNELIAAICATDLLFISTALDPLLQTFILSFIPSNFSLLKCLIIKFFNSFTF
ncbi:MAG: hypothetical protein QMC32_00255 [Cytophagales bacterium]